MTTTHLETERKFDAPADRGVPDLRGVHGIAAFGAPTSDRLRAEYWDTSRLDLARHGITLRRREGGADSGWHLKTPSGRDRRVEHRLPLDGAGSPPEALVDLVRGVVRDRPLTVVARVDTDRTETPLLGVTGEVLALVADDLVAAETFSPGEPVAARPDADRAALPMRRWREWEVELVKGDRDLLAAASRVLCAGGAHPGSAASKLARALGERLTRSWPVGRPRRHAHPRSLSATALLGRRMEAQVDELLEQDLGVRAGDPVAVHRMRIAVRRLRSAMSTYGPLLEAEPTQRLRDELTWLGLTLGAARDAQVLHERLHTDLEVLRAGSAPDAVAARVDRRLEAARSRGRLEAARALTSPRYYRLLDVLESYVADLPVTPGVRSRAVTVVPALLRRDARRYRRAADRVVRATTPEEREEALHATRKAAKRLRYAAESAVPLYDRRATRIAHRAQRVQEALGTHRDAVVARRLLAELEEAARAAGEDTTPYAALQDLENAAAAAAEAEYDAVARRLGRDALRRLARH